MRCVEDLYAELKRRYNGSLPFKKICEDEGIIAVKTKLDDGLNGFYISSNGHKVIVLNSAITYWERRDHAFHELYHHFKSPNSVTNQRHLSRREEARADLFAALCRIPSVREGDTVESIMERCSVCASLARIRLEYEIKKMGM